ncbi:hypothetical protein PVAP13_7NG311324 [Panicum virgatum]|uniref:Uncharacterized protein n=1 Tax=Panicum virgatum TaxID=38727 RepID=A0A8T0Q2L9_PANVG|nr:hypothetical protein PVAP13_7NG311324 [Panicum virgatum]
MAFLCFLQCFIFGDYIKKFLSYYFAYREDELVSSFAFISAWIATGHGGIIRTYPGFLRRGVTLL